MAEGCYTIILAQDARSAFKKIRIPARLIRVVFGAAGAVVLALVALLVHYASLTRQMSELKAMRLENAVLSERARRYDESLGQVEIQIAQVRTRIAKLAEVSGLQQALPGRGVIGMGGVTGTVPEPPSRDAEVILDALSRSLSELSMRSQKIETFYADQSALLSHTPSVWPVRGYFSSGFGDRIDPFTGGRDFHGGIDVSAPLGAAAVAPADGVVVAVGRRGAYGLAIVIDHGYGIVTRYGHLDRFNVRAGQRVRRGDVIGFVGNTGRSNAPHLHYEVWLGDKAQNPVHYILDEYRSFE